jgi:hypothetical protein
MIKSTTSRYWHLSVAQADLTAGELGQLPQEDIDRMDAHMMRLEGMSMRLHDKLYQVEALLQSGQSVKELKLGDKRNRGSLFESMAFLEAMKYRTGHRSTSVAIERHLREEPRSTDLLHLHQCVGIRGF